MTKNIKKILFLEDSISESMVTQLSRVRKLSYLKSATYRVSWEFTCKTTKILLLYIFLGHNRNVVNTKFPYPIKRLEVIRGLTRKAWPLTKVCLEQVGISIVVWINVQYMPTWRLNPFCRNRDELENKGLDSAGGTQSKFMGFQSLHNSFVEVSDEIGRASCRERV